MKILISTSKTMKYFEDKNLEKLEYTDPVFIEWANNINRQLKKINKTDLQKIMKISPELANRVFLVTKSFKDDQNLFPAIRYFSGDIFRGVRKIDWDKNDYIYSQNNLRIISGLYGILKPLDRIKSYRLEMGYKIPGSKFYNLANFWKDKISKELMKEDLIFNLMPLEYSKAVFPLSNNPTIVSPQFLVKNQDGLIKNIIVNTKTTRGLMASWLIKNRVDNFGDITKFNLENYTFDQNLTQSIYKPVFVRPA